MTDHSHTGYFRRSKSGQPLRRKLLTWKRIVAAAVVGVLGAVALAPTLISHPAILNRLVAWSTQALPGRVEIKSARLRWLSPNEIYGLTVWDATDSVLLQAERLSIDRSLVELVRQQSQFGTVQVTNPTLFLVLNGEGSNLQDYLAAMPESEPTDSTASTDLQVNLLVENGCIDVSDTTEPDQTWSLQSLNVESQVAIQSAQALAQMQGKLATNVFRKLEKEGQTELQFAWQTASDFTSLGTGEFQFHAESLPLDLTRLVLARMAPNTAVSGSLQGSADGKWSTAGAKQFQLHTDLSVANLVAKSPELQGDVIQLDRASLNIQVTTKDDTITVEQMTFTSDVASAQAVANVQSSQLEFADWRAIVTTILDANQFEASGDVQLVPLTGMLKNSLALRADTQVTGGQVKWSLQRQADADQRTLTATIESKGIAASRPSMEIAPRGPINITLALREADRQIRLDEVVCQSAFLGLRGTGGLDQGRLAARIHLGRLASELSDIVDLQGQQFDGELVTQLQWETQQNAMHINGRIQSDRFLYQQPNGTRWDENDMQLAFQTMLTLQGWVPGSVNAFRANLVTPEDTLDVQLTQPVAQVAADTRWPLRVRLQGSLEKNAQRFYSLLPMEGRWIAGQADVTADMVVSPQVIDISQSQVRVQNFRYRQDGVDIREPQLTCNAVTSIDLTAHKLVCQSFQLTSSTMNANAQLINVDLAAMTVAGNAKLQGEIAPLMAWFPSNEPNAKMSGKVDANAKFVTNGVTTSADVQATLQNFKYQSRQAATPANWDEVWFEPQAQLAARMTYNAETDELQTESFELDGDSVDVQLAGNVQQLRTTPRLAVQGKTVYHLEKLAPRLQTLFGTSMQLAGSVEKPFEATGPLWEPAISSGSMSSGSTTRPVSVSDNAANRPLVPLQLKANAGVGWDQASAYGLSLGSGSVDTRLEQGVLSVLPVSLQIGGGTLAAAPKLDLRSSAPVLYAGNETRLDQVELTAELCRTWFRFVAPLLADSTEAEGKFSVQLNGARVPLYDTYASQVAGNLGIHGARIGPGPLAREFLAVAQQIKSLTKGGQDASRILDPSRPWLTMPEHQIAFDVRDGTVRHNNLTLQIADVQVQTAGAVAFDERISLVAKIPVQDDWIGNERWLAGLRGTTLDVPVTGTLSRPQLDKRVFATLTQKAVTGAAESFIQDEVQNQLQRLFKRN
ncbi:MAG: hypothetical protein R3C28_33490 [Pirellulaceae bacterium]